MLRVAKLDVEVWLGGVAFRKDVCQVRRSLRNVAFVDNLRDVVVELVIGVRHLAIEEIAQDGPFIARGLFLKRSECFSGWRCETLDEVIGHHHVDHILCAPLGHVAGYTLIGTGMPVLGDHVTDALRMAVQTDACVVGGTGRSFVEIMRVVTRLAGEGAFALEIALRLTKAEGRAVDFKVVSTSVCRITREVCVEVTERVIGIVTKRLLVVVTHAVGEQGAGSFQVALFADLHLAIAAETRGIEDGGANLVERGLPFGSANVCRAWTVTALALNAQRQSVVDRLRGKISMQRRRNLGIGVVAEHALIRDDAARHRSGIIEARIHAELAAIFRIPRHRQLDERAVLFTVQIGAGVIAGPHYVVDRELLDIVVTTVKALLPAALEEAAVMRGEAVPGRRGLMVEGTHPGGAINGDRRAWRVKGMRHAGLVVPCGLVAMAVYAGLWICIA